VKNEGEFFFRALRRQIRATHLYALPSALQRGIGTGPPFSKSWIHHCTCSPIVNKMCLAHAVPIFICVVMNMLGHKAELSVCHVISRECMLPATTASGTVTRCQNYNSEDCFTSI